MSRRTECTYDPGLPVRCRAECRKVLSSLFLNVRKSLGVNSSIKFKNLGTESEAQWLDMSAVAEALGFILIVAKQKSL